jgi:hypothetical protein
VLWATTPGLLDHFGLDGVDNPPNLGVCTPRAFWISSRPPSSTTQATRTQGIAASVAIRELPRRYCCNAFAEHIENIVALPALPTAPMFFTFPDDARWNAQRQAVEFGVEIGEYRGVVRVPRRVFQRLLPETPTPERCVETYHLQRTRFEKTAERKLRRRQLTEDGNVEITGLDLRESTPMASRSARLR